MERQWPVHQEAHAHTMAGKVIIIAMVVLHELMMAVDRGTIAMGQAFELMIRVNHGMVVMGQVLELMMVESHITTTTEKALELMMRVILGIIAMDQVRAPMTVAKVGIISHEISSLFCVGRNRIVHV